VGKGGSSRRSLTTPFKGFAGAARVYQQTKDHRLPNKPLMSGGEIDLVS
jgi:hypothetical protein